MRRPGDVWTFYDLLYARAGYVEAAKWFEQTAGSFKEGILC